MKDDEKHLKEEQEKHMEILKDEEELLLLAKTVQVFGFVRSFRIDVPCMALGYLWNLITEIGKRLGIEPLMIKFLSSRDVEEALLEKIDYKELIEKRKKGFISILIDDKYYETSDKDEMDEIKKSVSIEEEIVEGFVKGNVAFPGVFEGTARVLHHVEDMKKIEKGDVLIISMTDPNYIPAMEKAGAFVTDMGGILCHAAIVSREMKKPCIIGTKNATSVFRDGDKIIVDGEKGEVRKV
jgi:phosphoenolpyruvate synthase/pyruvate phosphate dikinase